MSQLDNQEAPGEPDEVRRLRKRMDEAIAPYAKRIVENSNRIGSLISLYASLKKSTEFSTNDSTDEILRACVVFIHATLEDLLRTLAVRLYPEADQQALNQIPLLGADTSSGRAEKFSLGRLVEHKGKTVNEVITMSVSSYFERSNFNSTSDISNLLKNLGINVANVSRSFPKLDELMKRRHIIVHRADRSEPIGSEEQSIQKIEPSEVMEWLMAVVQFFQDVMPDATKRQLVIQGDIEFKGEVVKLNVPKNPSQQ